MSGTVNPLMVQSMPSPAVVPQENALGPQSDPLDFSDRYNTQLSPQQEAQYQAWAAANNRQNDTYDYDMRGAWQSGIAAGQGEHYPDTYKKPNHPTFSSGSQYNGVDGYQGGTWSGGQNGQPWAFTPGVTNLQMRSPQALQQYFASPAEAGRSVLVLPQGYGR